MKKVLFIDRDGTLIKEPVIDEQVDSFEKLEFVPGVFYWLGKIVRETEFELVMVTNQDGLGTASFPEETFWPVQNFMLKAFENEGIIFSEILIDRSFESEGLDTRKPGLGLMGNYRTDDYDLENSFVIGDRLSDMQLAKNLNCHGLLLPANKPAGDSTLSFESVSDWKEIYLMLKSGIRKAEIQRKTAETTISVKIDLDGSGFSNISTGIKFFDHMLEQLSRHGNLDLELICKGDLDVDEHHTIEDTALALGEAFYKALGSKKGLERYGFSLPMDDAEASVSIDFGGRPWLVWGAEFNREKIGEMPTEMFMHFFKSFSDAAKCNLNIKVSGQNEHHKIEAIFKAWARAIKMALKRDPENMRIPSTKEQL